MARTLATNGPLNLSHPIHDGLVASWRGYRWRLGGPSLKEELAGRDAVLMANAAWSPSMSPPGGSEGGSITCDGSTTTGLLIADDAIFALTSFTLSAWFYPLNSTNYQCLFARGLNNGAGRWIALFMVAGTNAQMYYAMNGVNVGPIAITNPIALNAWNHALLTCSLVSGSAVINLYVNGSLAYNNPSASPGSASVGFCSIGNEVGAGGASHFPFAGQMGPVDLWGRALSAAEAVSYYDLLRQGDSDLFVYSGLVGNRRQAVLSSQAIATLPIVPAEGSGPVPWSLQGRPRAVSY